MVQIGYTMMTEQAGPRQLVADVVRAEQAGFDFSVVVAQKAATVQLLSEGRFRLGLGSGENLNEHVVGRGWPTADVRHDMLAEAVEIIRQLFDGGYVTFHGQHFDVEAGFTEVALLQVGGDAQESFLEWAETTLLPALREL